MVDLKFLPPMVTFFLTLKIKVAAPSHRSTCHGIKTPKWHGRTWTKFWKHLDASIISPGRWIRGSDDSPDTFSIHPLPAHVDIARSLMLVSPNTLLSHFQISWSATTSYYHMHLKAQPNMYGTLGISSIHNVLGNDISIAINLSVKGSHVGLKFYSRGRRASPVNWWQNPPKIRSRSES